MKLQFTPQATDDLAGIADFLRERNPQAAQQVRASILESLQALVTFPHAGRRQNVEGVYKFVTRKHRYLIYYAVDEENAEIIILSVRHPKMARDISDA